MSLLATDQIIKELCIETGEPGFINYNRVMGCVLDGIRDLNIYSIPSYGIATLEISMMNSVDWPTDCIKPLCVFIVRNNRMVILDIDDNLAPEETVREAQSIPEADCQINDYLEGRVSEFDAWNLGIGELYGIGHGFNHLGYIKHNKDARMTHIVGSIKTGDQVKMLYKSDGLSKCPDFVPAEIKEALEYFALHKYFRTRNPNLSEVNLKNYKERITRLNKFYGDEGIGAWVSAMNSNVISAPK